MIHARARPRNEYEATWAECFAFHKPAQLTRDQCLDPKTLLQWMVLTRKHTRFKYPIETIKPMMWALNKPTCFETRPKRGP